MATESLLVADVAMVLLLNSVVAKKIILVNKIYSSVENFLPTNSAVH